MSGNGLKCVTLVDDSEIAGEPDLARELSFRVALCTDSESGCTNNVPIDSKSRDGLLVDHVELPLQLDGGTGRFRTAPLVLQINPVTVSGYDPLGGVLGGRVNTGQTIPNPDVYNIYHRAEYPWQQILDQLGRITAWEVECPNPAVQQALQNILVAGIMTDPTSPQFQEYVTAAQQTNSRIIPAYRTGSGLLDIANVVAAMWGIVTAANCLNDLDGRINCALGFSGGAQSVTSSAIGGNLRARELHLFGPVLLAGDLDAVQTVDQIYVYRGYGDWIGWLGYFELYFENLTDFQGNSFPAFTINVKFGGAGRVQRRDYPLTHTGPNGIRRAIPQLFRP